MSKGRKARKLEKHETIQAPNGNLNLQEVVEKACAFEFPNIPEDLKKRYFPFAKKINPSEKEILLGILEGLERQRRSYIVVKFDYHPGRELAVYTSGSYTGKFMDGAQLVIERKFGHSI